MTSQPDSDAAFAMQVGRAIHALRTERGLSQAQLAERAGMRQPTIARLESGTSLPSMRTVLRLARALDSRVHVSFGPQPREAAGDSVLVVKLTEVPRVDARLAPR